MEYGQELDKIKTEVTNSGKKLEDLSQLMQNLSGLTKLQDSINNFQEDNVLNRIETKIDILAQTDYSELFNFSVDNLKDDLAEKNDVLTQKINSAEELNIQFLNNLKVDLAEKNDALTQKIGSVEELNIQFLNNLKDDLAEKNDALTQKIGSVEELNIQFLNNLKDDLTEKNDALTQKISFVEELISHFSDNSEKDILSNLACLETKITEISENISSSSQFDDFQETLNSLNNTLYLIKTDIETVINNPDTELIKSKINYISTKLNDYNETIENKISEITENLSIKQDLDSVTSSIQGLHSNIDNLRENFENNNTLPMFENIQNSLNTVLEKLQNNTNFYNSSLEDLAFLKDNFYKINEKFSEITHLIRTNTAESEELNNRFESNITSFNSGFHNIYERFNNLDNTFNSSFADFKVCIQDIYDQFSTIDSRSDLDQLKFYVQSFNNKILSIAEILETLKENNFSLKIDNREGVQELQETKNKIELLNNNICTVLNKIDNNTSAENEKSEKVNEKLNYILNETQTFSNKISDEFSSLASPLSTAIELTGGLKESIDELLSKDDMQVKKETAELLDKFETVYKNSENNFEYIFNASKLFYEKLEEVKNDFSNVSYDTNSKIEDFLSKADSIEFKIQNNLSTSENALNSLKNISRFTETQINLTSESINLLKTGLAELSEEFGFFKNDITDISSKINKLILNEKENSTSFISSFLGLKEEMNKIFEANLENLNKTGEKIVKNISPELKDLNKKIDKAEEISAETLETAKEVKDALVYMAEWFDSAGKLLEDNNKNSKKTSTEIEKTNSVIKRTEENLTEQIKRISDKLNRFEIRIESIEGKIEKLHDQQSNREVLNVLSDILEKVDIANERSKSNEFTISRLENLELKLEELESQKTIKSRKRLAQEKV